MPLFEYLCRECSRRFEALVLGKNRPVCPGCRSVDLEKLFSTFAVGGSARSAGDQAPVSADGGSCGRCGDPRGPGSCSMD